MEWVSVIIAVAALGAAVWSAKESAELRRVERERVERERDEARRQFAVKINAWIGVCPDVKPRGWWLVVDNASAATIHEISAVLILKDEPVVWNVGLIPPGRLHFAIDWNGRQVDKEARIGDEIGIPVRPITLAERTRLAEVRFMDANGTRWSRDARGKLSEELPSGRPADA